jgi:hypothetical protein
VIIGGCLTYLCAVCVPLLYSGGVLLDRLMILMTSRTGRRLAHLLELTFGCVQFDRVNVDGGGFFFDMNVRYPRAKGTTTEMFHMVGARG